MVLTLQILVHISNLLFSYKRLEMLHTKVLLVLCLLEDGALFFSWNGVKESPSFLAGRPILAFCNVPGTSSSDIAGPVSVIKCWAKNVSFSSLNENVWSSHSLLFF